MTTRIAPIILGLALVLPLAASCGGRFADTHYPSTGSVTGPALALAKQHRLGPDGLGQVRLGMTLDQAMATGQLTRNQASDQAPVCRNATESGAVPAHGGGVWVSAQYGVAKIEAYPGVTTPAGIGLGASVDDVKRAYPDAVVETEKDMGNGQIRMDDHYRAPVPGNPKAVYRFFVDASSRVDNMMLVLATQDCDVGYFD